jgi:hypothetical protein
MSLRMGRRPWGGAPRPFVTAAGQDAGRGQDSRPLLSADRKRL